MRTHEFHSELWLPRPLSEVFSFFADAGNLELLTPASLHFEILTPRPLEMRVGLLIDYRLRLRGIPVRWQSEITAWEPMHRFIDEQRRGPYRLWHHEHLFEEREGGTFAIDRLRYAVPGGALVNWLIVRHEVARIFAYRTEKLRALYPRLE